MNKFVFLSVLLIGSFAVAVNYVSGKGVFLKGYDPTAYFTQNKALKGKEKFTHNYDGLQIQFVSQESLELFKNEPDKYMPEYKGWCAYALAHGGKLVDVNPKSFKVIDEKLYLFYDSFWTDTLKKWNEGKDESQIEVADESWKKHQ